MSLVATSNAIGDAIFAWQGAATYKYYIIEYYGFKKRQVRVLQILNCGAARTAMQAAQFIASPAYLVMTDSK